MEEENIEIKLFDVMDFKIRISRKPQEKKTFFSALALFSPADDTHYIVIKDQIDLIFLIEILKAFANNKLNTSKTYEYKDIFTAKTVQKNGVISLSLHFTNFPPLYLDKFECNAIASSFQRVLSQCAIW